MASARVYNPLSLEFINVLFGMLVHTLWAYIKLNCQQRCSESSTTITPPSYDRRLTQQRALSKT
ncbi:hypothetical protein BDN70DRAFT_871177 [Pholiota conissans]|uniref:Uncharacterized protein n=1 Tax=Pholiota conissans TaxID=109636 RepID=A0A9P5ZE77_9AGAR|nr:hypothetical protein BDN70DRAFT_871177 [Pholiota conissans]